MIFIILIVIIGIVFTYNRFNNNIYHSTTTSGLVINKALKPYKFTLKGYTANTNLTEEIEIIVKDENLWNLIEKDRCYFVNYYWKNNEIPVLGQIEINDEFGKIYSDKLIK